MFCVSLNGTRSGTSSNFPCSCQAQGSKPHADGNYLFEKTVEVNMDNASSIGVQEDVLAVPVSKSAKHGLVYVLDV